MNAAIMTLINDSELKESLFSSLSGHKLEQESANSPIAEFTIDELARTADTTVRNVRAYQDRGLIPPPERRGRVGIYTDVHLHRLKLIGKLLDRGYTLGNILELITASEKGHDLNQLLGLGTAISGPWTDEVPGYFTLEELIGMFAEQMTPQSMESLSTIIELGLIEPEGDRFRAYSPRLVHVGAQLVQSGIDLSKLVEIIKLLRGNVEEAANRLVQIVVQELDRYGDELPPPEDVPKLVDLISQLKPLAQTAIMAEGMRAIEKAANTYLVERFEHILEHIHEHPVKTN